MDPELIAFLKAEFSAINARLDRYDARFEGIDRRFDKIDRRFGKVEDQNRHTHLLIEDLQAKAQLLAEGHAAQDEKIDRRFAAAKAGRKEDRGHLEAMMKAMFLHLSRRDDEPEERAEFSLRSAPD